MTETVQEAIYKELVLSYTQAGRVVPMTLTVVAGSLEDAVGFSDTQEVHDTFRRARDMADIPTQRVLKEALTNHRAESYPQDTETKSIGYRDPCAAWLPKEPVKRAINVSEAVKNYCIACGGNAYIKLCRAKASGKEAYEAFTSGIKATILGLYEKYWRKIPLANGYPANGKITLALIPATVDDFRKILAMENGAYA